MLSRRMFVSAIAVLPAVSLSALSLPALAQDKLPIVASFSILADLVQQVGGERVAVTTLVGPGGDAHVYQPKVADGRKLAEAKVVFANGLGFEGWMGRLVKASGTKAPLVTVSAGISALKAEDDDHDHKHGHKHDHGKLDPHAWQSVSNVKVYVANIRAALIAADPAGKASYEANAAAYLARLDMLEKDIRDTITKIPADRRRIITGHDAFGYFKAAYGLDFVSPQGVSTEAEASAKDVARIIKQIRKENIPAVFLENISDPRLAKRIADETGAKIGGTVFSDALTDDKGAAPTYIGMMRHNLRAFAAALITS